MIGYIHGSRIISMQCQVSTSAFIMHIYPKNILTTIIVKGRALKLIRGCVFIQFMCARNQQEDWESDVNVLNWLFWARLSLCILQGLWWRLFGKCTIWAAFPSSKSWALSMTANCQASCSCTALMLFTVFTWLIQLIFFLEIWWLHVLKTCGWSKMHRVALDYCLLSRCHTIIKMWLKYIFQLLML